MFKRQDGPLIQLYREKAGLDAWTNFHGVNVEMDTNARELISLLARELNLSQTLR